MEEIEKGKLDVSTAPAVTVPCETTLDFSYSILTSTQMIERSETANQQSLRGVGPYGPYGPEPKSKNAPAGNDIVGMMKESIISAEHMGERMVDSVPCHHLSFESTGADWQVRVQKWDKPVLKRFAVNFINVAGNPQYLAMFKEWRINPGLDEQIFTFTPPFGTKEVGIKKSVGSKTVQ